MSVSLTMRRLPAIILVLLALAAGGWAVSESRELAKLRTDLAALDAERASLRKKIWAAEKLNRELARRSKDDPAAVAAAADPNNEDGSPADGPGGGRRDREDLPGRFVAMMDNPEMQRLMSLSQKASLDGRYSALFKNLHLSPADLDKFKNLLVEKQTSIMDVMAAARAQGLNPRSNGDEIRALVKNAQSEVDNNIRATLGDAAFTQYQTYEKTLPQRTTVTQLDQRLSYSSTPLTDTQSEQLVQVLSQNQPEQRQKNNNGGAPTLFGGGRIPGVLSGAAITDQAVTQAQGVLSTPQLAAMQQLQQEQQAQAQLAQQMRAGMGGRRNGNQQPTATPPVPPKG